MAMVLFPPVVFSDTLGSGDPYYTPASRRCQKEFSVALRLRPAVESFLLYISLFILPGLLSAGGESGYRMESIGMMLQFSFFTVPAMILCLFLLAHRERGILKTLLVPGKSDIIVVLLLLPALVLCALLYQLISNWTGTEAIEVYFVPSITAWIALTVFTLGSVFLEELFFRGLIPKQLVTAGLSPRISLVLSALLFSFAHFKQGFPGMTQAFFAGLFLGWAAQKTGRLVAPIVSHSLFNMAVWIISLS